MRCSKKGNQDQQLGKVKAWMSNEVGRSETVSGIAEPAEEEEESESQKCQTMQPGNG